MKLGCVASNDSVVCAGSMSVQARTHPNLVSKASGDPGRISILSANLKIGSASGISEN